ncbi:MAG: glycosyltransferase family 2 protein [Cyclobacteriaceae bacterium]
MDFKVSVIIPVYNSEYFLANAVASAASLPEVGEILLVEDGSTDFSWELCLSLARDWDKVRSIRHSDRQNHGVSSTRNLGIVNSRFPYIAFLDSDDYYLSNRFEISKAVFQRNSTVDGVYEAAQYENLFLASSDEMYSLTESLRPEDLFYWILDGRKGHFCTNAITIKKQLFQRAGLFLESLRMHEDTELWLRLAFYGKLVAGNINSPVAIVRRHHANAIKARNVDTLLNFYRILLDYYSNKPLSLKQTAVLLRRYCRQKSLRFDEPAQRRLDFYFSFWKLLVSVFFSGRLNG